MILEIVMVVVWFAALIGWIVERNALLSAFGAVALLCSVVALVRKATTVPPDDE